MRKVNWDRFVNMTDEEWNRYVKSQSNINGNLDVNSQFPQKINCTLEEFEQSIGGAISLDDFKKEIDEIINDIEDIEEH